MKITMQAKDMENMVNVCSMAISGKPMNPVNECVHLQAKQDEGTPLLTMIGKDVGLAIQKVTDRVVVVEDGEALIPAKTLLNFLKLMDDEVTLTVDGKNMATLKSKGKKANIACINGADYEPGLIEMENPHEAKMNGMDFEKLVNSVSHCVSVDTGRLVLTGVNIAFSGEKASGGAESCGLDGFRVAIARQNVETNDNFSALIPGTVAKLIGKIIKDSEDVSFRFEKGAMIAEAYDTAIEASLLAGEYMDYKNLIKSDSSLRMKLKTDELLNAVRMARISSMEGKKDLIILTIKDEDTLEVSAMSDTSGAITAVPAMVEGQLTNSDGTSAGNEIAINGRYLEDCLKAQTGYGEEMIIECKEPVTPLAVKPVNRDDYFQLVLPVRRS